MKGKFYAERNWEVMDMSQVEEFVKIVEGVKDHDVKVVIVTGKPGSGKSKVLREAAEEKKWDYIDCRLLNVLFAYQALRLHGHKIGAAF